MTLPDAELAFLCDLLKQLDDAARERFEARLAAFLGRLRKSPSRKVVGGIFKREGLLRAKKDPALCELLHTANLTSALTSALGWR